jgi:hypothetical protein
MNLWRGSFLFVLASASLTAQSSGDTIFHSATKLVQVSVVAQDMDGKPVPDLRREDFQILDNGEQREIRLFRSENAEPPPKATAPGAFTNRIAAPEGLHSGYSVMLFDNLNTGFEHTARARLKALEAFQSIPLGDKIAMYSLWCQFRRGCGKRGMSSSQIVALLGEIVELARLISPGGNAISFGHGPS